MGLPVFEIQDEILAAMGGGEACRVLLRAPTGSGKSTGVPLMLLEAGVVEGRVLVVQPRRIAARMLAEYVSKRNGTRVGEEVGYAVRFDRKDGPRTRVVYLTDGVLQRWMQENPRLPGVGAVLFDEFHERRLASDLALARALDLQEGDRPDLKLMVMSATLETGGLREYLAPCKLLEAGARMYPVEIAHRADPPPRRGRSGALEAVPVWERVGGACREALEGIGVPEGGERVLVFLPGAFEIRKSQELLEGAAWARGWEVKPLYSALAPAKQWEAVGPGAKPRIILATNVAETSITIDGIRVVVDAGTARKAAYDPRREIDTLTIQKISRASAEQRAGRAGRTGPGRCLRLWSAGSHARRAEFEQPEVRRVDLAEAVLYLKAAGVRDVAGLPLAGAAGGGEPGAGRAAAGVARGDRRRRARSRSMGRMLGRFPLHPRQARLLAAALEEDCVAEACFAAAVLQGDGVFSREGDAGPAGAVPVGERLDRLRGRVAGLRGGPGGAFRPETVRGDGHPGAAGAGDAAGLRAALPAGAAGGDGAGPGRRSRRAARPWRGPCWRPTGTMSGCAPAAGRWPAGWSAAGAGRWTRRAWPDLR